MATESVTARRQIASEATPFYKLGDGSHLFQVMPGIRRDDAESFTDCALGCVKELLADVVGDYENACARAWAAEFLVDAVRALRYAMPSHVVQREDLPSVSEVA